MSFRSFLLILLLIFFGGNYMAAQTHLIDSLKKTIINARAPESRLNAMLALCEQRQSLNTDTLFYYATLAQKIATELKDKDKIVLADYFVSNSLSRKGKLDEALAITIENLAHLSYKNNQNAYTKFAIQKGQLFIKSSRYKEALAEFYKILNESEQEQDTLTQISAKTSIGWVNMEIGQNSEALSWFYKSLNTSHSVALLGYFAVVYSNMAATYNELGKNDSAEYYINKAIAVNRQTRNNLQYLANALAIEADIYLDTRRKNLAEAPLNEALAIRKQIDEPFYIVSDMMQLAVYYAHNDQPEKGTALCIEGIDMARKFGLNSKLPILYDALAENYKAAGNFEKYGEALSTVIVLKDSLYAKNSAEALATIQAKYDAQKKENIITQQKFALIEKNYWMYGSMIVMFFATVALYFIFKNYKRRQQIKLLLMLEKEKRTAEKAVMDAEENERKRIAADLHDNLGAYAASIASNIDNIKILPGDTGNVIAMQELRNNSQSIVSQLNDTIWVLKKDALLMTAISDRLKIFIQRIQSSYPNIKIDVFENIETDHLLPPSQAFHLFQVLQEAINNAVRHSGGKQVNIIIESGTGWKIIVSDDGKGMAVPGIKKEGNGILNMKNRSREAGWTIEWQTNTPAGTQLIITPTTN